MLLSSIRLILSPEFKKESSLSLLERTSYWKEVLVKVLVLGLKFIVVPCLLVLAPFFKGLFETELKKGELIEAVEFEVPEKSGYAKFPNPASRYAIVGVYIAKLKKEVRVAITGVESCVFRCKKIEDALSNNFSPSAIDNINISSKGFNADIHASAEYRAHIIKVMAKKAVSSC